MKKLITLCAILLSTNFAYSQYITPDQMSGSLGFGQYDSELYGTGYSFNLTANYAVDPVFYRFSFRSYSNKTFYNIDPGYGATTIALLIGQSEVHDFYKMSYSLGFGFITGEARRILIPSSNYRITPVYKSKDFVTFSVPLEFDISIFPTAGEFGIGATLFLDINKERPMTGLIFKIDVGK